MNKALWIYLSLYNVYLSCILIGLPGNFVMFSASEIAFKSIYAFLMLSTIILFLLRPFLTSKLPGLVLLLSTSMIAAAIIMHFEFILATKVIDTIVTTLLVVYSIILLPIAFVKREYKLNNRCWMIMPVSFLMFFLFYFGKNILPKGIGSPYFFASLEYGCIIVFFYSLLQNASFVIRKCLKE